MQSTIQVVVVFFLLCAFGESTARPEILARPASGNAGQFLANQNHVGNESVEVNLPAAESGPSSSNSAHIFRLNQNEPSNGTQGSHFRLNEAKHATAGTVAFKRSLRSLADFLGLERDGEIGDDEELPVKGSDQEISLNEDPDHKPDLQPRTSEDIDDREGEISDEEDPPVKEPEHEISVDESLVDGSNEGRSTYDGEDKEY